MDSSLLTEKLPAICGNATLAIVSSNTNIKADAIVGKHANQGFILFSFISALTILLSKQKHNTIMLQMQHVVKATLR